MKNKLVIFSLLLISSATTLSCGTLNNPFLPTAELSVTSITSTDTTNGVSILQTYQRDSGNNLTSHYAFNDPVVTIENKPGLPRVIFKQMITQFTLAGSKLPAETKPIVVTVPSGGSFNGSIPILSSDDSLLSAVFPNNTFSSSPSGTADVTLLGLDDNNNVVSLQFTTPIKFETDPTNFDAPQANATPSPSPTASPQVSIVI